MVDTFNNIVNGTLRMASPPFKMSGFGQHIIRYDCDGADQTGICFKGGEKYLGLLFDFGQGVARDGLLDGRQQVLSGDA